MSDRQPREQKAKEGPPAPVHAMLRVSDVVHMVLAAGLLALAVAVVGRAVYEALDADHHFYERTLQVLDSLLLVLILLEVFRMSLAHFDRKQFAVGPFVVIGIISTLREVITGGAELSVQEQSNDDFRRSVVELGLNGLLVIGLVIALVLIQRSGIDRSEADTELLPED